ncbi:MAG TPA: GEVED domain-containing protein, partial [Flavobacteriales bacterium]|nr:GEVED domain-containing protein [Flavobacteriales bacterium]
MTVATCCVLAGGAMAQVGFSIFSQSTGTYTPITGTQLSANMTASSGAGSLDAVSTALTFPGGFSFTFNGTPYTDCRVSTDGNITFGTNTTNSSAPLSSTTAWNGVVAAFARDLQGGYIFTSNRTTGNPVITVTNGGFDGITVGSVIFGSGIPVGATVVSKDEMAGTVTLSAAPTTTATGVYAWVWNGRINYELLGTAPNRTMVIQWSNFKPFGQTLTTVSGFRGNFQIRLNEADNSIEVVYGPCSPGVGTTITTGYQVGLRGPNNTFPTNVNNRTVVKGTNDWATSSPGTSNTSTCVYNDVAPSNVIPSGLTYRWDVAPALNVAAGTVIRTSTGCFGATESLSARITNAGTGAIDLTTDPVSVSVSVGGAGSGTLTGSVNTGTLASGATLDIPLTPTLDMSAAGTYTFATTASMTGDGNAGDNLANSQIVVTAPAAAPQLAEFTTFTGANLATVHPGWSEATGQAGPTGTTSTWEQANAAQETGLGSRTARVNLFFNTRREWIVAPRVTVVGATDELTFKAAMTDWNAIAADPEGMGASDDSVNVRISTNCGLSWTTIYSFNAANLNGVTNTLSPYVVPLGAYAGQQVIIGIFATDGTADNTADYDFHVDDVRIGTPPTCLAVTGLAITGATTTSLTGGWNVEPGAGGYEWEVRTSGVGGSGATGLVQTGNVGTNSVTVSSLTANTAYTLWVRSDCTAGSAGYSTWVSVGAFTGYCVPTVTNAGDYISGFSTTGAIGNITNPTGAASPGNYGDFTAQTVSAADGATFNYSLSYVGGTNGIRVWVDWNNNLVFEGSELMSTVGPAGSPQNGTVTVPPGTPLGSYRMRVRAAWNVLPAGPCGNESYGETED